MSSQGSPENEDYMDPLLPESIVLQGRQCFTFGKKAQFCFDDG